MADISCRKAANEQERAEFALISRPASASCRGQGVLQKIPPSNKCSSFAYLFKRFHGLAALVHFEEHRGKARHNIQGAGENSQILRSEGCACRVLGLFQATATASDEGRCVQFQFVDAQRMHTFTDKLVALNKANLIRSSNFRRLHSVR